MVYQIYFRAVLNIILYAESVIFSSLEWSSIMYDLNLYFYQVPPPWLIAQQRYGPPPSYPNLKIPGLNAPIPDGCAFGYHAGGWGKPPVDETGKPLYGDVFGHHTVGQDVSFTFIKINTYYLYYLY